MSKLEELFTRFDEIQAQRVSNAELIEELDNGSARDAERREDMLDAWDRGEADICHELVKLLRPESFGNVGPAVAQAAEMQRLGYDAFATADGRITAHLTVSQSLFIQGVTAVANTREAKQAVTPQARVTAHLPAGTADEV